MLDSSPTKNELLELLPYLTKRERVELDRLLQTPANKAPEFRGGAREVQSLRVPEWILSGPAETGKTFATLYLLDSLARQYPRSQWAIVRKVRHDMDGTVLQTFEKKVIAPDVQIYGGSKPERYIYPNGATVWVGGMDRPGSILSGERDGIYVNQAEELALEDWETCTTRTTGRAGNVPFGGMLFGDCNPGPPSHWIKQRASLVVKNSRHEDNPTLFDAAGNITERGKRTMAILDALTGVRKERLRFGRWVSAEGAVYAFDPGLHEIDPFPIPAEWRRVRVIDFGFTNPFVCQWWAIDGDGRMYLYREIYMTGRTVRVHSDLIKQIESGVSRDEWAELGDKKKVEAWGRSTERFEATVTDHDAEDRATLEECGIYSTPANKEVSPGIEAVQTRLEKAGDGKPRLFVMRGALVERDETLAARHLPTCTREEFDVYLWPKAQDGRPLKDAPVKLHDHGMDAMRYVVRYIDGGPSWLVYGL